jgi:hypothetical protein
MSWAFLGGTRISRDATIGRRRRVASSPYRGLRLLRAKSRPITRSVSSWGPSSSRLNAAACQNAA